MAQSVPISMGVLLQTAGLFKGDQGDVSLRFQKFGVWLWAWVKMCTLRLPWAIDEQYPEEGRLLSEPNFLLLI